MTDQLDSLKDLFDDLAGQLGEVDMRASGASTEYRRASEPFAVVDGAATVELRLNPEVAEAARRTPHAELSRRGAEWVRFAPAQLDRHATDRAEAWFRSAWRTAGPGPA